METRTKSQSDDKNVAYTMEDLVQEKPTMAPYAGKAAAIGLVSYLLLMFIAKLVFPSTAPDAATKPDPLIQHTNAITTGIFATNAILNLQMCLWSRNPNQKANQLLTFVINIVSGLSHCTMALGIMPVYETGRDRWLFLAKYIEWFVAGGLIPFLMCHTAHLHPKFTIKVSISCVLMMVCGFIAKVTPPGPDIAFYILGWIFFFPLIYTCVFLVFIGKLRSHSKKQRFKVRFLAGTQLFLWLVFPIMYMVADFGAISQMAETIYYTVDDVSTKCVFTWVLNGFQFETQEMQNEDERDMLDSAQKEEKKRFNFVMRAIYN